MPNSNRVSTVIQSLGLTEGRPSRSSFSRSSSQAHEGVVGEMASTDGTGSSTEKKKQAAADGVADGSTYETALTDMSAINEKEKPETQLSAMPDPLFSPRQDAPDIQLPGAESHGEGSLHSNASTDNTSSSFASPLVLPVVNAGLHPRFNSLASEEARLGLTPPSASLSRPPTLVVPPEDSPSITSALHSHPPDPALLPRRAATLPSRRHASFSIMPIDTGREAHWEGKDVVATPYPGRRMAFLPEPSPEAGHSRGRKDHTYSDLFHHKTRRSEKWKPRPQNRHASNTRRSTPRRSARSKEESLLITVQDIATSNIRSSQFFIPSHPGIGSGKSSHDDEELAYRMRDSYLALRGPWKSLFLARGVTGVHLHSDDDEYEASPTQHDFRDHKASSQSASDNGLCHDLLGLFHTPRTGKRSATTLGRVNAVARSSQGNAAIQLVEGWSVPRIALACAGVLLASILAMLLWVLLGVGEQARFEIVNATASAHGEGAPLRVVSESSKGLQQLPGDRVGAGAVLGLLVLFLGWSTVGMWMFLSYLVG